MIGMVPIKYINTVTASCVALDSYLSTWFTHIDTTKLDLESSRYCIIGQLITAGVLDTPFSASSDNWWHHMHRLFKSQKETFWVFADNQFLDTWKSEIALRIQQHGNNG